MRASSIAGLVLLGALIWGLYQTAVAPLETGEVYPPYSSLRSDPLGAKALFESLGALPDITVERLYKDRATLKSRDVLFVLGVESLSFSAVPAKVLEEYEKLVQDGGRLVIAFMPARAPGRIPEKRAIEDRWHVKFNYDGDRRDRGPMPRETSLFFETDESWGNFGGGVERPFGKGSIVLVADTFPLSNEGLREARDSAFVAALAGKATHII